VLLSEDNGECFPDAADPGWIALFYFLGTLYMFLALAIVCDEFFVPSLEQITLRMDISNDVAGATLMAAGGSAPELFTSAIATFKESDIGFAAIVGSAVFNVLFVIGVCAFTAPKPLELTWWPLARDCSYYAVTLALLAVFFMPISKQKIEHFEAAILFALYFGYVVVMKFSQKMNEFISTKLSTLRAPKDAKIDHFADDQYGRMSLESAERVSRESMRIVRSRVRRESMRMVQESNLYRSGFRAGMINMLTKDEWDFKDVASITVVNSICGDVQETFKKLDVDDNGYLDLSELGALLEGLEADISRKPIEELMEELDLNHDGKVSFEEFSKWYIQSEERILGAMRDIFEDVDEDKDGVLNAMEMRAFLRLIEVEESSTCHISTILGEHVVDQKVDAQQTADGLQKVDGLHKVDEKAVADPVPEHGDIINLDQENKAKVKVTGMTFEDFKAWFVTTSYYEAKLEVFRKQAKCMEAMDTESMLSWPTSWHGRFWFVWTLPLILLFVLTVPDTRKPEKAKWSWLSFVVSILWIGFFSFWLVEWTVIIGDTLQIPTVVMGLTFLAAGTSIPDLLSSVIVAKQGYGDMAVSSSIGSNIFDVTVGLPLPWLLYIIYHHDGRSVYVSADGLIGSILILLGMLVLIVAIIGFSKWRMTKLLGALFMLFYGGFVAEQLAVADWSC